jgi:predicted ATPase
MKVSAAGPQGRDDRFVASTQDQASPGDGRLVRAFRLAEGEAPDFRAWPGTVPAVAQILRSGLDLPAGLTVLVGENGSGKSTVVELLAEAYGLNPQGGSQLGRYESRDSEPGIGRALNVVRGSHKPRWAYFVRPDTMHGLYTYLEDNRTARTKEPRFHEMSHGEGFLEFLRAKVNQPGFYLLDEPDAPLSFTASLALVRVLHSLVSVGSQLMVATHSPILAAIPGATILEVGDLGPSSNQMGRTRVGCGLASLPGQSRPVSASPAAGLGPTCRLRGRDTSRR